MKENNGQRQQLQQQLQLQQQQPPLRASGIRSPYRVELPTGLMGTGAAGSPSRTKGNTISHSSGGGGGGGNKGGSRLDVFMGFAVMMSFMLNMMYHTITPMVQASQKSAEHAMLKPRINSTMIRQAPQLPSSSQNDFFSREQFHGRRKNNDGYKNNRKWKDTSTAAAAAGGHDSISNNNNNNKKAVTIDDEDEDENPFAYLSAKVESTTADEGRMSDRNNYNYNHRAAATRTSQLGSRLLEQSQKNYQNSDLAVDGNNNNNIIINKDMMELMRREIRYVELSLEDVQSCAPITPEQQEYLQQIVGTLEASNKFLQRIREVETKQPTGTHVSIQQFLEKNLLQSETRSILELGCGPGMVLQSVQQIYKRQNWHLQQLVGIELVPGWVQFAESHFGSSGTSTSSTSSIKRPIVYEGDMTDFTLEEGPFDLVMLNDVLTYVHPHRLGCLLQQLQIVTHPNSVVYFHGSTPRTLLRQRNPFIESVIPHQSLIAGMAHYGFELVSMEHDVDTVCNQPKALKPNKVPKHVRQSNCHNGDWARYTHMVFYKVSDYYVNEQLLNKGPVHHLTQQQQPPPPPEVVQPPPPQEVVQPPPQEVVQPPPPEVVQPPPPEVVQPPPPEVVQPPPPEAVQPPPPEVVQPPPPQKHVPDVAAAQAAAESAAQAAVQAAEQARIAAEVAAQALVAAQEQQQQRRMLIVEQPPPPPEQPPPPPPVEAVAPPEQPPPPPPVEAVALPEQVAAAAVVVQSSPVEEAIFPLPAEVEVPPPPKEEPQVPMSAAVQQFLSTTQTEGVLEGLPAEV